MRHHNQPFSKKKYINHFHFFLLRGFWKISIIEDYLSCLEILSLSILISRKSENNEEESTKNWYDCLIPNCCRSFQCCELKVPTFITDFQNKLKNAEPSRKRNYRGEKRNQFSMFRETIKNIWRQESWFTFIVILLILSVKPIKFLTFDVVFPAVDVYTDSDAAIKHFE